MVMVMRVNALLKYWYNIFRKRNNISIEGNAYDTKNDPLLLVWQ